MFLFFFQQKNKIVLKALAKLDEDISSYTKLSRKTTTTSSIDSDRLTTNLLTSPIIRDKTTSNNHQITSSSSEILDDRIRICLNVIRSHLEIESSSSSTSTSSSPSTSQALIILENNCCTNQK